MKQRKKFLPYLLISILSLIGTLLLIYTFDPQTSINVSFFSVLPIIPFFALLFLSFASFFTFILANLRRGITIASFLSAFLLLQYLHLNSVLYTILLLLIVILLEVLFWKKK